MSFSKLMGAAMELLKIVNSTEVANESPLKAWPSADGTSVVTTDSTAYHNLLESLACDNSKIASRFSRATIYKFIEDRLPRLKRSGQIPESSEIFFKELLEQEPTSMLVSVPISGIRLDGGVRSFELACFRFGYLQDLEIPMANQSGMYISTTIKDAYDKEIAFQKAENAFLNFAKLIIFLSGKQDKSILIETGLPLKPDLSHEQMYVSTNSYQIQDVQGRISSANVKTIYIEKIPVNNDFFTSKEVLGKLWELYDRKHAGAILNHEF